jgi:hypothetical protein
MIDDRGVASDLLAAPGLRGTDRLRERHRERRDRRAARDAARIEVFNSCAVSRFNRSVASVKFVRPVQWLNLLRARTP